jgi:hypothetical protein
VRVTSIGTCTRHSDVDAAEGVWGVRGRAELRWHDVGSDQMLPSDSVQRLLHVVVLDAEKAQPL